MRGNSFGTAFRLTTFGESHGPAIGGVIDGCPSGLVLDLAAVQAELDRRRPGSTPLGTARKESDTVEFLSGLMPLQEGDPGSSLRSGRGSLGAPIGFLIRNADAKSSDYDHLKDTFRPGHADLTWEQKFEHDVWYVDNRSFWLDLQILWRTIWLVLARHGIQAEGEATMGELLRPPSGRNGESKNGGHSVVAMRRVKNGGHPVVAMRRVKNGGHPVVAKSGIGDDTVLGE